MYIVFLMNILVVFSNREIIFILMNYAVYTYLLTMRYKIVIVLEDSRPMMCVVCMVL